MADIRTASFDAVSCRACVDVMHGLFFGILQHSPKASPDAGGLQTAPHICSVFRELEHRSVRPIGFGGWPPSLGKRNLRIFTFRSRNLFPADFLHLHPPTSC